MPKLLCLDFDETCVKVSYFKKLRFEKHLPGLQAAEIQTPQDIIVIKQAVTEFLDNPDTGLKNADELEMLFKDALRHGDCVAITSYNDYPDAIALALVRLNLSPTERASIYLSCHLPFYGVDGARLRYGQAEFDDSRGKNLHIQEALRYFQSKGKQIDAIVLLDDNSHSIDIVNQVQHTIDGIPTIGALVDKNPKAMPTYITTPRELLELHHDVIPGMLGYSLLDMVKQVIAKYSKPEPELPLSTSEPSLMPPGFDLHDALLQHYGKAKIYIAKGEYRQAESQYVIAMNLALRYKDYEQFRYFLVQLGDLYLEQLTVTTVIEKQQMLTKAAALYNRALCFYEEGEGEYATIHTKIITIVTRFLALIERPNKECGLISEEIELNKIQLDSIREWVIPRFNDIIKGEINASRWWENTAKVIEIQNLHKNLTYKMKEFMQDLLQKCFTILGEPPCGFAIIAFGSTAREEITPYSDFEWGILLDNDEEENKPYFRTLTNLLHLMVINLGETTLRTMGMDIDDYNVGRKGFSFDGLMSYACKWPLGKPNIYNIQGELTQRGFELIGSPSAILAYQTSLLYDKTLHFPSTLSCVTLLTTGQAKENLELEKIYKAELSVQLGQCSVMSSDVQLTFGQQQALESWHDDMLKFFRSIREVSDAGRRYDVKKDLYRLPNILLGGLGLYYELRSNSGWDKIDELCSRKIICENSAQNLKRLMSIVTALRLHTYLTSGNQRELLAPYIDQHTEARFYERYLDILFEMYKIILPFANAIKIVANSRGSSNPLREVILYDDSKSTQGRIYYRLRHYQDALICMHEALTMRKGEKDYSIWGDIGNMLYFLGEYTPSAYFYSYAATVETRYYGREHLEVSATLHNLGNVYDSLGNTGKAVEVLEEALTIQLKHYQTREHIEVTGTLHTLANLYGKLGNTKRKKDLLEDVLATEVEYYQTREHITVARTLHDLAITHGELGDTVKKKDLLEEVLAIETRHYKTREHIEVTRILHNLADAYGKLGNTVKKKGLLEEALVIKINHYRTREHIELAKTLYSLANAYGELGDPINQKDLLEEVLAIETRHYQTREHIEITKTLHELAKTYGLLGDYCKKKDLLEEVLTIETQYYQTRDHFEVAITLGNLANAYGELGNTTRQKDLLEEALTIQRQYYQARQNIEVVNTLHSLAIAYGNLGNSIRKKDLLEELLEIQIKYYQTREHIEVAKILHSLANTYGDLGDTLREKKLLEEVLEIQIKYYKTREHIMVARTLHDLAIACGELGHTTRKRDLLEEVLKIQLKYYKIREHVEIAKTLHNLAVAYGKLGDPTRGKELLEEVLLIQIKHYQTREHIEVAKTLHSLAIVYGILGDFIKKRELLEEVLAIEVMHYKTREHIEVAKTFNSLASVYNELGEALKAKELLEEVLKIQLRHYQTTQHPAIAMTMINVAIALSANNYFQQSLRMIKDAYQALLTHPQSGIEHPTTRRALAIKQQLEQVTLAVEPTTWLHFKIEELTLNPSDGGTHLELGNYYLQTGEIHNAIMYYEEAVILLPREASISHNLACCYHVRGQDGDLVLAEEYFERAIRFNPSSGIYCEYGHFFYQRATQTTTLSSREILVKAIMLLKQAISLAEEVSTLNYGALERPVIEKYLQSLVIAQGEISIKSKYLAYYLLIKAYIALEVYSEAKQVLNEFEEQLECLSRSSSDTIEQLKVEFALLNKIKYLIQNEIIGSVLRQQTMIFSLSEKFNNHMLEKYRHSEPRIQHEYDKRFGLIPKL